jgi:cysteine desulfuration protein SufE
VDASFDGELMHFAADADAIVTKGIIGLLVRVLNKQKPEDIAKAELKFIDEIGLKEHLSPTRSNGLVSMVKQMKMAAIQALS